MSTEDALEKLARRVDRIERATAAYRYNMLYHQPQEHRAVFAMNAFANAMMEETP